MGGIRNIPQIINNAQSISLWERVHTEFKRPSLESAANENTDWWPAYTKTIDTFGPGLHREGGIIGSESDVFVTSA